MDEGAARNREREFLSYTGDAAAVYRLGKMAVRSVPLERARLAGESPAASGYDLISTGPITRGIDALAILDEYRANGFAKPGDIVAFKQAGTVTCWYVDHLAFSKLPGLLDNYLAAAEMSVEGNYNQIDGIINNEAPKPSVLDTLRQCQEDAGKSQGGTAPPSPSRDPER